MKTSVVGDEGVVRELLLQDLAGRVREAAADDPGLDRLVDRALRLLLKCLRGQLVRVR